MPICLPASEVLFGHVIRSCSSVSVLYCKHDLFSNFKQSCLHVLYRSHAYFLIANQAGQMPFSIVQLGERISS